MATSDSCLLLSWLLSFLCLSEGKARNKWAGFMSFSEEDAVPSSEPGPKDYGEWRVLRLPLSTFGVSVQMASGPWVEIRALSSSCRDTIGTSSHWDSGPVLTGFYPCHFIRDEMSTPIQTSGPMSTLDISRLLNVLGLFVTKARGSAASNPLQPQPLTAIV